MKLIKTLIILLVIVLLFGVAMFALNLHTAPIIESNNAGAELAPLLAVMPEGSSFGGDALIYSEGAESDLNDVSEEVLKIYKEAKGNGFAVQCRTIGNYEPTPMTLTFGVTADGKICGLQIDNYTDSIDVRAKDANYIPSFIGKDSALADVNLVAGCTYSSASIKNAVSAGLSALISNSLIAEGVKDASQILTELIPTVHTGMASGGALKATEITPSGNITAGYAADNGSGFALIIADGDASYLAVVNAMGACKVYDTEGADVTADKTAVSDEAKTFASANQEAYADGANKKFASMVDGASEMTAIELDAFNSVVYAASFNVGEETFYGFYSRYHGFELMDIYIVIDSNGAIADFDAKELIFHKEYFTNFDSANYDEPAYKSGFDGITFDTFTGENTIISSATITSNAVKGATSDIFAAYDALVKGGEQ
ncbi:MAG: hypothetical protein U0M06_11485 [Clostridia bacterium]|nr:hypothetical protein [Clostridia bacterium]